VLTPSGHGHKTVLWTYRMDPNLTTLQCMARHTCTIISPCLHSTHGPTHLQRPPQHCDTSAQLHGHVTTLQVSCTPFHRPLHPQLTPSGHGHKLFCGRTEWIPILQPCNAWPGTLVQSSHRAYTPHTAPHTCRGPHNTVTPLHSCTDMLPLCK
jgi:hypothetical protein